MVEDGKVKKMFWAQEYVVYGLRGIQGVEIVYVDDNSVKVRANDQTIYLKPTDTTKDDCFRFLNVASDITYDYFGYIHSVNHAHYDFFVGFVWDTREYLVVEEVEERFILETIDKDFDRIEVDNATILVTKDIAKHERDKIQVLFNNNDYILRNKLDQHCVWKHNMFWHIDSSYYEV